MPTWAPFVPFVAETNLLSAPVLLLVLGEAGLYVASRAAVDALGRNRGDGPAGDRLPTPGRLALGHWVPIVAVVWMAAAAGQAQIALGVVFGSSVACLSLALGLITYLAPPQELPPTRRAWPFVLAGAMLPLLAGFSSHLNALHAVMMLLLGWAVAWVWNGAAREGSVADVLDRATSPGAAEMRDYASPEGMLDYAGPSTRSAAASTGVVTRTGTVPDNAPPGFRAAQWVLAIALAIPAAKAAVLGTIEAGESTRLFQPALLAGAFLSPLLILPMLASGTDLAHRNRSSEAATALVGMALLNLFALLPVVILLWYVCSAAPDASLFVKVLSAPTKGQPIPLPLGVWRIDTVVLAVLGFAVLPIALGRWRFTKLESVCLVVIYAGYLFMTAYNARS